MMKALITRKLVGTLIRHGMAVAGGWMVAEGYASAETWDVATGGAVALGSVALSAAEKHFRYSFQ